MKRKPKAKTFSKTTQRVLDIIKAADGPVVARDLRPELGDKAVDNAVNTLRTRLGIIKTRHLRGIGMELLMADKVWPPVSADQLKLHEKALLRQAERLRHEAQRTRFKPEKACGVAGGSAREEEYLGHPFFCERFVPYLAFFPEKTRRKYERTIELRKQAALVAENRERFGRAS